MQCRVYTGERPSFQLSEALIIYRAQDVNNGDKAFVTRHNIVTGDNSAPRVAPGELVETSFVKHLMTSMLGELAVEILPENVLVRTTRQLVWWTRPAIRPMFYYKQKSPELAELSGKKYPQPALLFSTNDGGDLTVRALKEAKRPTKDTRLYLAPYWNVYDSGDVCIGTMRTPRTCDLGSMALWEKAFFESEFNHQNTHKPLTVHPRGFVALWKEICGKKAFPVKYLADAGETLQDFVNKHK